MGENEERRDAVEKRELHVARREAALVERLAAAEKILEAADLRDGEADLRDDASVTLDQAADLAAFVHPKDGDSYTGRKILVAATLPLTAGTQRTTASQLLATGRRSLKNMAPTRSNRPEADARPALPSM